jgi:transposase
MQLEFTPESLKELNYERYRHPLPLVQRGMDALWLKSHGLPHGQSAQLGHISENTLRDYFHLYQEGGVERLKEGAIQGPESARLEHHASLEAYFRAHPPATMKEAQNKLEALTGSKRSETQEREYLKKNSRSGVGASACSPPTPTPSSKRSSWGRSWSRVEPRPVRARAPCSLSRPRTLC